MSAGGNPLYGFSKNRQKFWRRGGGRSGRRLTRRQALTAALAVLLLVGEVTSAIAGLQPFPFQPPKPDGRAAGRAWEGGGSGLLFVDDFSAVTASAYDGVDPYGSGSFAYYLGAVPERESEPAGWDAARWRHDLYRWGQEGLNQTGDPVEALPWSWDPAAIGLRFGQGTGPESSYPTASFGAAVSPVIDLRPVPRLPDPAVDTGQDGRLDSTPIGVLYTAEANGRDRSAATGVFGPDGVYPDRNLDQAEPQLDENQTLVGVDNGRRGEAHPGQVQSTAILRLVHDYDFQAEDGKFLDGGRVEAASYDPVTGWSSWEGLTPTAATLVLGDQGLEGRRHVPGRDGADARFTVDPDGGFVGTELNDDVDNQLNALPAVSVGAQDKGLLGEDGTGASTGTGGWPAYAAGGTPWLHSGLVEASLSSDPRKMAWDGFGGSSNGPVESVFDLSRYAGHEVRLRFVAATLDGDGSVPALGWRLSTLEVHAAGTPAVDVLGFPAPGDGALLPSGDDFTDFTPVVALQNRLGEPVRVEVNASVDGRTAHASLSIGAGPDARRFLSFGRSVGDLLNGTPADGLHHINVSVLRNALPAEAPVSGQAGTLDAVATMHFQVGGAPDWAPLSVRTEKLDDASGDAGDRLVARGQKVRITVALQNEGPTPLDLSLDPVSGDLRPLLTDRVGNAVGQMTPDPPATVHLPVSREGAGSLGEPDAVRTASWTWSGNGTSQPLDLAVQARSGGAFHSVLPGGRVLVESSEFAPLSFDAANQWRYDSPCLRRPPEEGRSGLLQCGAGGHARSPAQTVTGILLQRRGGHAEVTILHQGGGGTVRLLGYASLNPTGVPPPAADPGWKELHSASVNASGPWTTDTLQFGDLAVPTSFTGWVVLAFDGPAGDGAGPWRVDDVHLNVGPPGRGLPVAGGTFDVDLQPESSVVRSLSGANMAVLRGGVYTNTTADDQEFHNATIENPANPSVPVVVDATLANVCSVGIDHGDVTVEHPPTFPLSAQCSSPSRGSNRISFGTKAGEDAVLELPGPFRLDGARPELRFRHLLDPGQGVTGVVETALDGTDALDAAANGTDAWRVAAEFRGQAGQQDLTEVRVPLWDRAGETVRVRFRLHHAPDSLAAVQEAGRGWFIDAVSLEDTVLGGHRVLHTSTGVTGTFSGYTASGVVFEPEETQGRYGPALCSRPGFTQAAYHFRPGPVNATDGCNAVPKPGGPADACLRPGQHDSQATGPSLITDPVDLTNLKSPILVLDQGGQFNQNDGQEEKKNPGRRNMVSLFDVEYQVLGPAGWGPWHRATPHETWRHPYDPFPDGMKALWSGQAIDDPYRLADLSGNDVTSPFADWMWGQNVTTVTSVRTAAVPVDNQTVFTLDPRLAGRAGLPGGHVARFRFLAWQEAVPGKGSGCPSSQDVIFDWALYRMEIRDLRPLADAGIGAVRVTPDDSALLDRVAPGALPGRAGKAVLAGDPATVLVDVLNPGRIGLDVSVCLAVLHQTTADACREPKGSDSLVAFIDTSGPAPRPTSLPFGRVHVDPGHLVDGQVVPGKATVRFRVDFGRLEPGTYTLQASADALGATDTDPSNDVAERDVLNQPFRLLHGSPSESRVEPLVATNRTARTVHPVLRNLGNVDESSVHVAAEVVEYTGLTATRPVGFSLEGADLPMQARVGESSRPWQLPGDNATLSGLLRPGHRYAVKFTLTPADNSTTQWWASDLPLLEAPFGPMPDLSSDGRCGCLLVPFLVESVLAESDLSPATSGSVVPDAFPVNGSAAQWGTEGFVSEGGQLLPGDGPGAWTLASQEEAAAGTQGVPVGPAWKLPAYEGHEETVSVLTSPVLPAHLVSPSSRPILDLRYASGLDDGQAVLEQRVLDGDHWSPWQPSDAVRARRVAVVLPPDFPQVLARDFGPGGYPTAPVAGHPIPPFYEGYDNGSKPSGCDRNPATSGVIEQELCLWAPFPTFAATGDREWVAALATVLDHLDAQLGTSNVGVFTTLGDGDLALAPLRAPTVPLPALMQVSGGSLSLVTTHGSRSFPLRTLDDLGADLGSYGAILLLGDGTTRTFPAESAALVAMSVTGKDHHLAGEHAGNVTIPAAPQPTPLDPLLRQHAEDLQEILQAAGPSGVGVVGSIGPAVAALARSGIAAGANVTGWVNPGIPAMALPPTSLFSVVAATRHCAVAPYTSSDPTLPATDITVQPKSQCLKPGVGGGPSSFDPGQPMNYFYVSARDAQSLAVNDFVVNGGASFALTPTSVFVPASGGVVNPCPPHLGNSRGVIGGTFFGCQTPRPVLDDSSGPVRLITAAADSDAATWADTVVRSLHASGALPGTGMAWRGLPLSLGTPIGGHFEVKGGHESFEGDAMQFRIVVRGDPAAGGHGAFLLDGFHLYGQPQADDAGVRILDPPDGADIQPGEPDFHPAVEVRNRGLQPHPSLEVTLTAAQLERCGGNCVVRNQDPVRIRVDDLRPGEVRVIAAGGPARPLPDEVATLPGVRSSASPALLYGGQFPPKGSLSPDDPRPMTLQFNATLRTGDGKGLGDGHAADDTDSATVHGLAVVRNALRSPSDLSITPAEAPRAGLANATVRATLYNDGSLASQKVRLHVDVFEARPHDCHVQAGGSKGYLPCAPDGTRLPEPLWSSPRATEPTLEIPRGRWLPAEQPIGLDAAGLGPGVYRVAVTVLAFGLDGKAAAEQHVDLQLHLAGPGAEPDGGLAAYDDAFSGLNSTADLVGGQASVRLAGGQACGPDDSTRGGDADPAGATLLHGWRWHPDLKDGCKDFQGAQPVLEWRRSGDPSTRLPRAWSYTSPLVGDARDRDGDGDVGVDDLGEADFGADRVVWEPLRAGQAFNPTKVNGVPLSLAAFPDGQAALALRTSYQAGPNTTYAVEMQVASLACNPNDGQAGAATCSWTWPVNPNDGTPVWTALAPEGFPAPPAVGTMMAVCGPPPGSQSKTPPVLCDRRVSNPLSGLPGIWKASSADSTDADDGFRTVIYPINAQEQGQRLRDACAAAEQGDSPFHSTTHTGLHDCAYAATEVHGLAKSWLPRPIRFRLSAASFGGDQGLNVWQVAGLSLTAHAISVDGLASLPLHLFDGEEKAVPFLVRNDGAVDEVVVARLAPADPTQPLPRGPGALEWGVSGSRDGEAKPSLQVTVPPGGVRKVWAHVRLGYESGLDPFSVSRTQFLLHLDSARDAMVKTGALVNATLEVLPRADLRVQSLLVDSSASGAFEAANGTVVSLSAGVVNSGRQAAGGPAEPLLVRFTASALDPATGDEGPQREVGNVTLASVVKPCSKGCLVQTPAVEWTPAQKGVYVLRVEVNVPRLPADPPQVPERNFRNNVLERRGSVGAVQLADLRALSIGLVPVVPQKGCDPAAPTVKVALAGHSYCAVAEVANAGAVAAVAARATFHAGSQDISEVELDDSPRSDALLGESSVRVASSPWVARLHADGDGRWQFSVEAHSATPDNNAADDGASTTVRVERHSLAATSAPQEVPVAPHAVRTLRVNVTNDGNAVTTPAVVVDGGDASANVFALQPAPLLPGANATLEIQVAAGASLTAQSRLPRLFLASEEDDRLRSPLPVRLVADVPNGLAAEGLPVASAPGTIRVPFLLDGEKAEARTVWTLESADSPLDVPAGSGRLELDGHGRDLVQVPLRILPTAAPGHHSATVTFAVTSAGNASRVRAPVEVDVLPAPRLDAVLATSNATAVKGLAATLPLTVTNSGNVPLRVTVGSPSAPGTFALAPGASQRLAIRVEDEGLGLRSAGELPVRWEAVGMDGSGEARLPWSVDYVAAPVRLVSTNLATLDVVSGRRSDVEATVLDNGTRPVSAEVLAVVDGVVQSRQSVDLKPGEPKTVRLPLLAGPAGAEQRVQVLVRPAGSLLTPEDPSFYVAGDAGSAKVVPQAPHHGPSLVSVPSANAWLALSLALIAAAVLRRRGGRPAP